MFIHADYAIGHASKRNNIQNIKNFKLNGIITDCYRSIFLFDEGLKEFVERTKSIKGYSGKHISDSLVFDFDQKIETAQSVIHNKVIQSKTNH